MAAHPPFTFAYFVNTQHMQMVIPTNRTATIQLMASPEATVPPAPPVAATITLCIRSNGGVVAPQYLTWGPSALPGQMIVPQAGGGNQITLNAGTWDLEVWYQNPPAALVDHCNLKVNNLINLTTAAVAAIPAVNFDAYRPGRTVAIAHGALTFT